MIYDIRLDFPIGCFHDLELQRKHIEALEEIDGFEEKLNYYNQNIRSLSCHTRDSAQISVSVGSEEVKLFCNCSKCKADKGFNPDNETIYLKLRKQEVERIHQSIKMSTTYNSKLLFLLSNHGFSTDNLKVYDNNGHLVIDLEPNNLDEIAIYNLTVRKELDALQETGAKSYFNSTEEIEKLGEVLQTSIKPKELLASIRKQIEDFFSLEKYVNGSAQSKKSESVNIDDEIYNMSYKAPCYLFAKLCLVGVFDFYKRRGNLFTIGRYVHVYEIFLFYKNILKLEQSEDSKSLIKEILDTQQKAKYKEIFEREVQHLRQWGKLPFSELIDSNTKYSNLLFDEFCKAALIPSHNQYIETFYTSAQIEQLHKDNSHEFPDWLDIRLRYLTSEFYLKAGKKVLNKKYYIPNLLETNIFLTLTKVAKTLEILRKSIFNKDIDDYKEAEIRASSIVNALNSLSNPSLQNAVLRIIVEDNKNILLDLQGDANNIFKKAKTEILDKWNAIKDHFNVLLSKAISDKNSQDESTVVQEELSDIPFIGGLFMAHLNISDDILDTYYGQVPQPLSIDNDPSYVGKINRYNSPYRVSIYGAYPLMKY